MTIQKYLSKVSKLVLLPALLFATMLGVSLAQSASAVDQPEYRLQVSPSQADLGQLTPGQLIPVVSLSKIPALSPTNLPPRSFHIPSVILTMTRFLSSQTITLSLPTGSPFQARPTPSSLVLLLM